MLPNQIDSTICALSTPNGMGAIALIRVSGSNALRICNGIFSKDITDSKGNSVFYGVISDEEEQIDEVVLTVFRNPHSFTGEDVVEIACHGSRYIQQRILQLLLSRGCVSARAGEFTQRAFLNGKMDLSQAEAVADLIASESAAAHRLALQQVRGGFSKEINRLRDELIHFASLIELELDFSEEDVEFADRSQLKLLINRIQTILKRLIDSFAYGNVLKNGIPVAIVGIPNVGKSTLLNVLFNEEKAIVSEVPGTTRDAIEDELVINGIEFRFIDTAGLRDTKDLVEQIGIEKTYKKIEEAQIVLYVIDAADASKKEMVNAINRFLEFISEKGKKYILVANKSDQHPSNTALESFSGIQDFVLISAKENHNIEELKNKLFSFVADNDFYNQEIVVTNARHHAALVKAQASLLEVENAMKKGITGDLMAIDIRKALHHLSEITGQISSDDLLGAIFSKFCIGK